jgi:hypothetical protein
VLFNVPLAKLKSNVPETSKAAFSLIAKTIKDSDGASEKIKLYEKMFQFGIVSYPTVNNINIKNALLETCNKLGNYLYNRERHLYKDYQDASDTFYESLLGALNKKSKTSSFELEVEIAILSLTCTNETQLHKNIVNRFVSLNILNNDAFLLL